MKLAYRFRGIILAVMALALWILPHPEGLVPASSAVLALLGVFVRVEARRVIGEHSRGKEISAPELSTSGIYSRIRHPLYLSNLCFGYAFVLFHLGWTFVSFAFFAAITIFEFSLANAEDAFLQKRFGAAFVRWKAEVPMFFPRCRAGRPAGVERRAAWRAFVADRWTWFWLLFYTLLLLLRRHLPVAFS